MFLLSCLSFLAFDVVSRSWGKPPFSFSFSFLSPNFPCFFFFCDEENKRRERQYDMAISPGAPPAPVRLSGQKIFEEKFSPFQWTGRWKFATNGGSSQHFYRRLNASKSARIESREDSKTHSVAKIGKNGVFFVKRARRFRNAGVLKTPESTRAPKMGESRITTRAFYKKNTIFPDFGDGKCLRILSTFDSRCF